MREMTAGFHLYWVSTVHCSGEIPLLVCPGKITEFRNYLLWLQLECNCHTLHKHNWSLLHRLECLFGPILITPSFYLLYHFLGTSKHTYYSCESCFSSFSLLYDTLEVLIVAPNAFYFFLIIFCIYLTAKNSLVAWNGQQIFRTSFYSTPFIALVREAPWSEKLAIGAFWLWGFLFLISRNVYRT